MIGQEGKKGEEKLEFTLRDETVVYIPWDRARLLNIEHTREKRDFYGVGRPGGAVSGGAGHGHGIDMV
tara:strand:- start:384 stop:587 length:204 start_codon:yes stop_codon:yes gene_type:complete